MENRIQRQQTDMPQSRHTLQFISILLLKCAVVCRAVCHVGSVGRSDGSVVVCAEMCDVCVRVYIFIQGFEVHVACARTKIE